MPLRYWGSNPDLLEDNEGQSVATLEKRGNKLYISIRVSYEWLQTATFPVFIDVDVDEVVGADGDDAYEYGTTFQTYAHLVTRAGKNSTTRYRSGCRFQTINIAKGSTIDTATTTKTAYASRSATTVNTILSGEDSDDAAAFADQADFDSRWANQTTAKVDWDSIPVWGDHNEYTSPDIKTIIQEIIDRAGWAANQDLVILWTDDDSTAASLVVRAGHDYTNDSTRTDKLHIEYTAGGVEKGPINSSVIVGVAVSASRTLAIDRDASVIIGNLVSASGVLAISRASSVAIGVLVTASVTRALSRAASVVVGNLVSASKSLAITRASSVVIGEVVTASKVVNRPRAAAVAIGVVATASRSIAIARSAAVIIGNLVSATATSDITAYVRSASVAIGVAVSASGIATILKRLAITLLSPNKNIELGSPDKSLTVKSPEKDITVEET
jgi:hypothetical protein